MKTVCSGWSMLPACRYALMRLLLMRNAAHVSVEAITLSCCLLSSCLWLSRWPSHARCLSTGIHSGTGLFVACGTAPTGRGKTKLAAVARGAHLPLQSFPPQALPQLSLSPHLPRKGDSLLPSFSLELGNPFYPQCFITPKPCGTAPVTERVWWGVKGRWAQCHHGQGWPKHGRETTAYSFAVPWRAPGQPQRSICVYHILKDVSAPAQMKNEPCRLVWPPAHRNPGKFPTDFQHCRSFTASKIYPISNGFWASSSSGRSRTPLLLLPPLGHPVQEHDSRELCHIGVVQMLTGSDSPFLIHEKMV